MSNFADRILDESRKKKSVLVVGLDPDPLNFPDFITGGRDMRDPSKAADAIFLFNTIVIDSSEGSAIAFKPQLAWYETHGSHGIRALEQTLAYLSSKGLIAICDAKRGDIDSTSAAYAKAFLGGGPLTCDAVTVNPFMGRDCYMPFIDEAEKNGRGVFILLKTSNPSSEELEDQWLMDNRPLYVHLAENIFPIAEKSRGDHGYSSVGFVVAATFPAAALTLRETLPHSLFLVPGFGYQGGRADELAPYFDQQGDGAVISSSRGIIYAYKQLKADWKNITREEMESIIRAKALKDRDELNRARKKY